jgi:N-methylhydantoinase B
MNGGMQGGGATATHDGVHTAHVIGSAHGAIPNVETHEQSYPILYLRRGLLRDSGGAGRWRGGLAGDLAYKPHGVQRFLLNPFYMGQAVAPWGIFGGFPGAAQAIRIRRATDVAARLRQAIPDYESLTGDEIELPPMSAPVEMSDDDVLYSHCGGGGGYGDPLERDPRAVLADVATGVVSAAKAQALYGVIIDGETRELNAAATKQERAALRVRRQRGAARRDGSAHQQAAAEPTTMSPTIAPGRVHEYLDLAREADELSFRCRVCGHQFSAQVPWRASALSLDLTPDELGVPVTRHPLLSFRAYLCPGCATCWEVRAEMTIAEGSVPTVAAALRGVAG